MTESEAIKWQKQMGEVFKGFHLDIEEKMNISCDMAINALKKQIAKKPINNKHTVSVSSTAVKVVDWWKCRKCNGDLTRQFACCPYCQTVIDWSDEE